MIRQNPRLTIGKISSEVRAKIFSHTAGKADYDEVVIRSGDGHTGAEDPGSEETKAVKMKKTPKQPSQRDRE